MIIGIHQPNFFPWLGYFYKIYYSDMFVFLDNVKYSKNSFINRVEILENSKKVWLTNAINYKSKNYINKTEIADLCWKEKHCSKIKNAYKNSNYFKEIYNVILNILDKVTEKNIADININIIIQLSNILNIKTDFYRSSKLKIAKKFTGDDRLIKIIHFLRGNQYLSGKGAANYQDEEKFKNNKIDLKYSSFQQKKYMQLSDTFIEGLSILDPLFNAGIETTVKLIKNHTQKTFD